MTTTEQYLGGVVVGSVAQSFHAVLAADFRSHVGEGDRVGEEAVVLHVTVAVQVLAAGGGGPGPLQLVEREGVLAAASLTLRMEKSQGKIVREVSALT